MLKLIYPQRRLIDEREVINWARDRMSDNALDVEMLRRVADEEPQMTDEEVERMIADTPIPTLEEAIERLQDDGVATFQKG